MAADNLAQRGKTQQVDLLGSTSEANLSAELEALPNVSGGGSAEPSVGLEVRLAALEARIRRLEARPTGTDRSQENLEALSERREMTPTVRLRTEGGGVPRLSDGFLGSFQRGQPGSAIVGNDVGVGVSVGVMF
jgi:hypothetical protein